MPRNLLAALVLGSFLAARAWPLEVSEGRLKLVLHGGMGRFSLYLDGIALFVDQDPRTSGAALLLDNRVYKLGDSGEFKESSETLPGGGRFTWTSKRLTVTQTFSFLGGEAVTVAFTIRNNSDREVAAGLRFLLDTYLGEAAYPHFRTERDREINGELSYSGKEVPAWWMSRSSRASRAPENPGLLVPLRGEGVTTPDRLVLANWKRLSEASWLYETAPGRTFSELPYSINDSAACLYFDPAPLAAGASRTYLLALSAAKEPPAPGSAAATAPAATASAAPPAAPPTAAPASPAVQPGTPDAPPAAGQASESSSRKLGIEGDLRVLDDLLQKLAQKMESRTALTEQERQLMEQIIADLKKRLESYGQ